MNRRNFLKWGSFLTVSAASTSILTACGGGDGDNDDTPPGDGNPGGATLSFSHGVASGDPKPDSIILWTRIEGADGHAAASVKVQVSLDDSFKSLVLDTALEAEPEWDYTVRHKVTGLQAGTIYFYRFIAGKTTSMTGRTKTAPAAGTPLSQLRFAFVSCQDWSVNHWAAFDELQREEIDFIVHLGDYIYEEVDIPVAVVPATDPAHKAVALPDGTKRADGSIYATTVDDYRTLYKTYRSDPRLQALHARFPMIAIWDDHEFSDDAWQDHQTYDADDSQHQLARRRSANQAWFEFMPADVKLNPDDASFQNIQIYRSFTFGNLATLVMTDERLYRADHAIPEAVANGMAGSRYLVPNDLLAGAEAQKMAAASGALTPVSMLGDTQRTWWQNQMKGAATTWKLWGNEVSLLRMQVDGQDAIINALTDAVVATDAGDLAALRPVILQKITLDVLDVKAHGLPGTFSNLSAWALGLGFGASDVAATVTALNQAFPSVSLLTKILFDADQWDGYNAERKALMSYLKTNGVQNVVALTGDIHAFFAGAVMDDFDAAAPSPVMVDLVTAGVSSTSLFRYYVDFVNATPSLQSLAPLVYRGSQNNLNGTLKAYNSWLKFVDTDAQGYAVVTLTPTALTCSFKKMKPIAEGKVPASPAVASSTQVVVHAGTPAVEVVNNA